MTDYPKDRVGNLRVSDGMRSVGTQFDLRRRLKLAREELGLSISQFARLTSISDLGYKESGKKKISLLDLYRLQEFINIEWFLFGEYPKRPEEMTPEDREESLPRKIQGERQYKGRLEPPKDWVIRGE